MSIWVSVYCRQPLGPLTAEGLEAGITERLGDYLEMFDQDECRPEVQAGLRVEAFPSPGSSVAFHIRYAEVPVPVVVSRSAEASGEVQEYLEEHFQGRQGKEADFVRRHLSATVEIVHLCLKQRHADGLG